MSVIEQLPVFAGLSRSELSQLVRFSTVQRYPPGTLLFREGERADKLHVIVSGSVEIFANGRGREWGVMLLNAGDVFMPGAVMYDEPYTASARTIRRCQLLLLDGGLVRAQAERSAAFAMRLGRAMAGQFRVAIREVLDLKSRSAAQRLGSLLLKVADTGDGSGPAELPLRKRNLAARVGMTPETLSRTLQTLADNGLVVRGRQIVIRDREQIERFCGAPPYCSPTEEALQVHAL